jgi:hypothetical protein
MEPVLDGVWVGQGLITGSLMPDPAVGDVADYDKLPGLSVHELEGVTRPGHHEDVVIVWLDS